MKLIDNFNRKITRLRISITSECNLNCVYCHHEGYSKSNNEKFIDLKKLEKLVPLIKKYEFESIKITGGEPLLHPHIIDIVRLFSKIQCIKDVSLTTNGLLLGTYAKDLKVAGLNRVNIGCDTISDSNYKNLESIKENLTIAQNQGISPIKLNMVVLKGVNDHQIYKILEFCIENDLILQLIELINTNDEFFKKFHISLALIEKQIAKNAIKTVSREVQNRTQYFLRSGGIVEFVKPVHNPQFCAKCNTLRITNDFQFQPCLNRNDNLVAINNNIESDLLKALKRREPYYVT